LAERSAKGITDNSSGEAPARTRAVPPLPRPPREIFS